MSNVVTLEFFLRLWPLGCDAMQVCTNFLEEPAASMFKAKKKKEMGTKPRN
jgi:hypothetical protein